MPAQLKTLVVVATTCTLLGIVVTYTVGQSERSSKSGNQSASPSWKADGADAQPSQVGDETADIDPAGPMTPLQSAVYWNNEMGDAPARLIDHLESGRRAERSVAATMPASATTPASEQSHGDDGDRATRLSPQAGAFLASLQGLESRLQELGASYYRLETSEDGRRFLFHCEMPLPEQPGFHRFFEASGTTPDVAMERVVSAVSAWVAAREARNP